MSAGITLFPLRRNVFGRPWRRAESGMEGGRRRHWSGDAAEGERERAGAGSELRRPRAFIYIPLSSVTRWERRRDAAATPSREPWRAPRPPAAEVQGSETQLKSYHHSWLPPRSDVKMLNKLGAVGGVGRGAVKTSKMGKSIH